MITNLLVSIKEVVKLAFLYALSDQSLVGSANSLVLLLGLWLLCQQFGNYIQGKWSDSWKRKQVLIISLISSLVALILIYFSIFFKSTYELDNISYLLWVAVMIDGTLGNVTPIAKAAYLDENPHKPKKHLFESLFFSQSYPWVVLPLCYLIFLPKTENIVIFGVLCIIIGIAIISFWRDRKDFDPHNLKSLTSFPIRNKYIIFALFAFLLSQIAYQSASYLIEEKEDPMLISRSYILFGMGVGVGTIISRFFKEHINHRKYVSGIFLLAFVFFILKFLSFSWRNPTSFLDSSDLTFLALFSGLYLPSVFAMLADKAHVHQQGATCGLLETVMSSGEFIAPYIGFYFLNLNYNTIFLILGSVLLIAGMLLKIPAQFPDNKIKE